MPFAIAIFSLIFLSFCAALWIEKRNHLSIQKRIPIRIHINGTRGKSSITRLAHSILVEAGWNVYSKATGSAASLLFPDRSERRIFRNKISISEQKSFLRFAARKCADAVVMECMAVQPKYQKESEDILISATHAVIANVRNDHGEWIDTEETALRSFAHTIPKDGVLIVGKNLEQNEILRRSAEQNRTSVLNADSSFTTAQIDAALLTMRYPEHRENVEIAIRLCETLGVTAEAIVKGIASCAPDPGALRVQTIELEEQIKTFVFAFAANDTISWEQILKAQLATSAGGSVVVVFNSKRERPFRTVEFANLFSKRAEIKEILFWGPWFSLFRSRYRGNAALILEPRNVASDANLWIGAGNYQGKGRIWMQETADKLNSFQGKEWNS
ncbi:poly-gamma-glutamate synthase PgsB [Leptospira sp. FAT2]|uniref:poly-gamma-glutamate synthase PgsB n=1 Tax=Leptospira sanjuanensis TaxID=2879643 RepID=UPI001EE88CAC|nr:poly-gamma-glutamate synthase PgsB [Leptospira sanjuanensis]MCG6193717.1 poly-gamma-glutamate synthase PgsB [Leptospira sanjuanensis]